MRRIGGVQTITTIMSGTIKGRVTNPTGEPIPDATIVVSGLGPFPDIAPISGDDGAFVLDDLPEGTYYVRTTAPTGAVGEIEAVVGSNAATPVTIVVNAV